MLNAPPDILALTRQVRAELAEQSLPPQFAKLYSQHTKLRAGRPGLSGWRSGEFGERLYDALRLIAASFVEQESAQTGETNGLRRAGEILEWLSHEELNTKGLPVELIASAAYQLAGYPARAASLLNAAPTNNGQSRIIEAFLRADFRALFQELAEFWADYLTQVNHPRSQMDTNPKTYQEELESWIIAETAGALAVLCADMRWGDEWRIGTALQKLASASKALLHGRDSYSWLLAKLSAGVMASYSQTSVRTHLARLAGSVDQNGQAALERYARHCYASSRALVWPSQAKGITRLAERDSFALCTPTGSGKTAVAELAILQSLFLAPIQSDQIESSLTSPQPMVIYLVPSRALAVEVEAKLSRVFDGLTDERVIVTGLYGGYDWGPTDAWLTANDKTVLICTFEKAEALMRFVGPLFLDRVTLIVIDEAHSVQFDQQVEPLRRGESRALRLECLGMRMMTHGERGQGRTIALSAVSTGIEYALSHWVSGTIGSQPVTTSYRSTRQLVGRLICMPSGNSEIRYDLLDGASLTFDRRHRRDSDETPYIPNPFPTCPSMESWKSEGPEKRVRHHLLWAAMHIARHDRPGGQAGVLISVTQNITKYAEDFLGLLDGTWANVRLPEFFRAPADPKKLEIWHQCLESCKDYFGVDSYEYQLLQKGIVLHHGKMPGLLARLLVQAIQERILNIVVATSTLSEGVNLPFETILIPTVQRFGRSMTSREFANLVGRAGRPGFGTEGTSLVLIPTSYGRDEFEAAIARTEANYSELVAHLQRARLPGSASSDGADARSPLAELLTILEQQWRRVSNSKSRQEFLRWLEVTAPVETSVDSADTELASAIETLDTLDGVLLSSIVELEQIEGQELSLDELEQSLQRIWQRSYARFASKVESSLMQVWLRRGRALKQTVYPAPSTRRRLYRTSLPPRPATALLELYPRLRRHLETGWDYVAWSQGQRLEYIRNAVQQLGTLSHFAPKPKAGRRRVNWEDVLHWWLSPTTASIRPDKEHISDWHAYVSQVFIYRFNWGLGSFIALAMDETYGGELRAPSLEEWPRTGLPWIVFWLKELITWGTLEPAATYLLSRHVEVSRVDAERVAARYYAQSAFLAPNDQLDASMIRRWAESLQSRTGVVADTTPPRRVEVALLRDFSVAPNRVWRVVPLEVGEELIWIDPAGFPLARCQRVADWGATFLNDYDFRLDTEKNVITWEKYL
jgi:hypothetical protein